MAKLIDLVTNQEHILPNKDSVTVGRSKDINDIVLPDREFYYNLKKEHEENPNKETLKKYNDLYLKTRIISREQPLTIFKTPEQYLLQINPKSTNKVFIGDSETIKGEKYDLPDGTTISIRGKHPMTDEELRYELKFQEN